MNEFTREKMLVRYLSALERGDFDVVMSVLQMAEDDEALETLILDYQDDWVRENDPVTEEDVAAVYAVLGEHALTPVTVRDVVFELVKNPTIKARRRLQEQVEGMVLLLGNVTEPLPDQINDHTISSLLSRLNASVSQRIATLFRSTAQILQQNQQSTQIGWSAARSPRDRTGSTPLAKPACLRSSPPAVSTW